MYSQQCSLFVLSLNGLILHLVVIHRAGDMKDTSLRSFHLAAMNFMTQVFISEKRQHKNKARRSQSEEKSFFYYF